MSIGNELDISTDFSDKVEINYEKVDTLTQSLVRLKETKTSFNWVNDDYWLPKTTSDELVSQFFTLGNSINFRYWFKIGSELEYCSGIKGGIDAKGAMYMWRCLKFCVDNDIYDVLDTNKLAKISFTKFKEIFTDDEGKDILPVLKERHNNWLDLGKKLDRDWNGFTINIIRQGQNSLSHFVKTFKEFRAFDDPLCKMIMVNAIMHKGRNIVRFDTPIIPGIDYQIMKQLLRQGVIVPNSQEISKLRNYEILETKEALELRKATLTALIDVMRKSNLSGDYIDNMIWGNRNNCSDMDPVCSSRKNEHKCPFLSFCNKQVDILIPLEETRYY